MPSSATSHGPLRPAVSERAAAPPGSSRWLPCAVLREGRRLAGHVPARLAALSARAYHGAYAGSLRACARSRSARAALVADATGYSWGRGDGPVTASVPVSGREAEVLEAVGAHLSNAQIAGRLHISVRTVESHVSALLRKFGVPDRRSLADLAPAVAARAQAGTAVVAGLPAVRTSFIGRSDEQAEVLAALARSRLVTLLGPGGVGKTRLSRGPGRAWPPRQSWV